MLFPSLLALGWGSLVAAKSDFVGMNIAGFEFGCLIDGTCPLDAILPPVDVALSQMEHFVTDDQMNIFRLPVSWQYLVNNTIGPLNPDNFATYDQLVQECLSTGAYCVIDLHNFARYDGGIIGQGGPTDDDFVDLWTQLASNYTKNEQIIFGLMNEPHDLIVATWADTLQAVVTAIRKLGATTQMILLPGTGYASAAQLVSSGSGDALLGITNPDGSTDGLIIDIHKYLDIDNSGSHADCVSDNIATAFAIVAPYLRKNKRLALVSETGAGNNGTDCITDFCAQNAYLNANSDVILGYIAWAAGSFTPDYILDLVPTDTDGVFVDQPMASECVLAPWLSANATGIPKPVIGLSTTHISLVSSHSSTSTSSTGTITSPPLASKTVVPVSATTYEPGSGSGSSSGSDTGTKSSAADRLAFTSIVLGIALLSSLMIFL